MHIGCWPVTKHADLGLVDYKVDTLSSDYDDFVDEFGIGLDGHGA